VFWNLLRAAISIHSDTREGFMRVLARLLAWFLLILHPKHFHPGLTA
jgi:hypothetical protein